MLPAARAVCCGRVAQWEQMYTDGGGISDVCIILAGPRTSPLALVLWSVRARRAVRAGRGRQRGAQLIAIQPRLASARHVVCFTAACRPPSCSPTLCPQAARSCVRPMDIAGGCSRAARGAASPAAPPALATQPEPDAARAAAGGGRGAVGRLGAAGARRAAGRRRRRALPQRAAQPAAGLLRRRRGRRGRRGGRRAAARRRGGPRRAPCGRRGAGAGAAAGRRHADGAGGCEGHAGRQRRQHAQRLQRPGRQCGARRAAGRHVALCASLSP